MKTLPCINILCKSAAAVILIAAFLAVPELSADRFELFNTKETPISGEAVDLAVSRDGSWTFVLTSSGEVAVYDNAGGLVQTLKTGSGYERLEYDDSSNKLILAGSGQKLKVLSLAMRFDIQTGSSPERGPRDAPVIITVFSDFQCPYCAKLVPLLEQVLEKYPEKVALQFKNYPLRSHQMARPAAMAALAADKQGHFWTYHDRVFENFRTLSDEIFVDIAQQIGLNMEQFEKDRKSIEINNIINRDVQEASRIGVRGTPTVFINGKQLGQRSLEAFSEIIENELKTARKP